MTTKTKKPAIPKRVIRSAYQQQPIDYQSIDASKDGLTEQHHFDSCCIDNIINQYNSSGQLPPANPLPGEFRELSGENFQDQMNTIAHASSYFESLPAATRKKFANNVSEFLDFVSNDENLPELEKMGLVKALKTDEPKPEQVPVPETEKTPTEAKPTPSEDK